MFLESIGLICVGGYVYTFAISEFNEYRFIKKELIDGERRPKKS